MLVGQGEVGTRQAFHWSIKGEQGCLGTSLWFVGSGLQGQEGLTTAERSKKTHAHNLF